MKSFFFHDLESTSSTANQWLESKKHKPPFVIIAATQEKGRGRLGRSWQSPIGNLYLSLALSANEIGLRKISLLPHKAAVVIADWILAEFGIRVLLKWPNDLLFGGKKIGGILCESTVQGRKISHAVVGLGLNLNRAPQLRGEYAATSLSNIIGDEIDCEKSARSFIRFCDKNWNKYSDTTVLDRYNEYGMEESQLWSSEEDESLHLYRGISADGSLLLESLDDDELSTVNSVDHPFRWVYQGNPQKAQPLFVCDVGNSAFKFARFAKAYDAEPELFYSVLHDRLDSEWLVGFFKKFKYPLFVSSVNSVALQQLSGLLAELPHPIVRLKKRSLTLKFKKYDFANLGIDRLVACEASMSKLRNMAALVVCAGTATTIDAINADREHLGGWILPGVGTSLWSMNRKTTALPLLTSVKPQTASPKLGFDTASAMLNGVCNMSFGAIQEAIAIVCQQEGLNSDEIDVFITGGYGPLLRSLDKSFRYDPYLVVKGIRFLALGGY